MNETRRKALRDISVRLAAIKEDLDAVKAEEETALENLPDSLQNSSRGTTMQDAIDAMEGADTDIESAIEALALLTESQS